jgi:predicted unusual protein kinase regulating ubiquinone biosynthesis (AarF/ABC1/UbiB family)
MGLSLKPERLKRYKDVVALLFKYGRGDLVQSTGLTSAPIEQDRALQKSAQPKAEELADDLERLGPTFIKLGQLLSTRGDLLPAPYLEALARLQDQVEPSQSRKSNKLFLLNWEAGFPNYLPISIASRWRPHRWPRCIARACAMGAPWW